MAVVSNDRKRLDFYTLGSLAIILGILHFCQDVLIPIAVAVLFAFLLAPVVRRLERWRLGRVGSTLIVIAVGLAVIGSVGWVVERRFSEIVVQLPQYSQSIRTKLRGIAQSGGIISKVSEEISKTTDVSTTAPASRPSAPLSALLTPPRTPTADQPLPVRVYPGPTSPIELVGEYFTDIASPIFAAGLVVVFVAFFLIGKDNVRERMVYLVGQGRIHVTTEAIDDAVSRVSRYLVAQTVINFFFGVAAAIGLRIIDLTLGHGSAGLAAAILGGLVCGILRFVPYVGVWIGASLPLAIAFAAYPGNGVFLATLLLFLGLEIVTSQAIEPNVLGARTGISPLAVLLAAVFWTWIWGPVGLVVSTPITVVLVVMGKYVPQLQLLDVLLSDRDVLDPQTRIYQRLVAGDDEQAAELAVALLKDMSRQSLYDTVLLPSLAQAEIDWRQGSLDDARHGAIRQGIIETAQIIAERDADSVPHPHPPLPKDVAVKVLCIPARDEADEIAASLLGQLVQRRGYQFETASAASLASEMIGLIDQYQPDAVVISAMPPKATTHARYILKRLTTQYPQLRLILGLWLDTRDPARSIVPDVVGACRVTSLQAAESQLDQLVPEITIAREAAAASLS